MKLRNKDLDEEGHLYAFNYKSLKGLNAIWEDYKPSEPLIKDKEVRKAIRAWADYNGVEEAFYFTYGDGRSRLDASAAVISFYNELRDLKEWKKYTIAELCGEEEQ